MALSHLSAVSKAVVLLEEGEGKEKKVPGKRAVAASVNSGAILGSAQSCIGAPPRPASLSPWGWLLYNFAGWKKSGGLAGGTQERGKAPMAWNRFTHN